MDIEVTRLDPTLAEVTIHCRLEHSDGRAGADYELAGRFVGPRCPHHETIELSYPVRLVDRQKDRIAARVLIPEPSFWTADKPLIYEGVIELRHRGRIIERVEKTLGFTLKQQSEEQQ